MAQTTHLTSLAYPPHSPHSPYLTHLTQFAHLPYLAHLLQIPHFAQFSQILQFAYFDFLLYRGRTVKIKTENGGRNENGRFATFPNTGDGGDGIPTMLTNLVMYRPSGISWNLASLTLDLPIVVCNIPSWDVRRS